MMDSSDQEASVPVDILTPPNGVPLLLPATDAVWPTPGLSDMPPGRNSWMPLSELLRVKQRFYAPERSEKQSEENACR